MSLEAIPILLCDDRLCLSSFEGGTGDSADEFAKDAVEKWGWALIDGMYYCDDESCVARHERGKAGSDD